MRPSLLAVFCIIALAGCGGFAGHPYEPAETPAPSYDAGLREITVEAEPDSRLKREATDRTLIYNAFFRLSSLYPDSVHQAVVAMAYRFDGFVLESTKQISTVRVPSERLDEAVKEIELLGEVIDKNVTGEDVTDRYLDLKIRLENAEKTRLRYLGLLDVAKNIEEILRIERELDRINKDIDLLTGKLNQMEHVIKYATVTVETKPAVKPGPVGWVFVQLYKGAKKLFVWD